MTDHRRFLELAATAIDFDLSDAEAAELTAHLQTCAPCRRTAAALRRDEAHLRALEQRDAPASVRAAITARRRPRRIGRSLTHIAAAAATLAAIGGGALLAGAALRTLDDRTSREAPPSGLDATAPPSQAARQTPSTTAPLGGPVTLAWREAADQGAFHDPFGVMEAVAPGGPGLVAVGDGCSHSLTRCEAAVWTSADGQSWARVPSSPVFDVGPYVPTRRGEMTDVAVGPGSIVGVGRSITAGTRSAAVWTSPDGLTWSRVAHDQGFEGGTLEGVVAGR